jgi:ribosomal-protein-alanine N-acetyltransferase
MLSLADAAIERGSGAWTLEVRVSSTGAQSLYQRFGFAPAGVRARYYENTEDAIVMWCNDIQGDEYRALLDSIRVERDERSTS